MSTTYNARRAKAWRARRHAAGGGSTLADTEPLRPILHELHERMSWVAVAHLCGTSSHRHVRQIAEGEIQRINHDLAARIRAAAGKTLEQGGNRINARGAVRRLRALIALGYSSAQLAEAIGYSEGPMKILVQGKRDWIRADTDRRIRDAYERLSMRLPKPQTHHERAWVTRSQERARRMGWAVPLAWDDIDRDEMPRGTTHERSDDDIDSVIVDRLLAGERVRSNRAEKVEAMRRWRDAGGSERALCVMHGWPASRYIEREEVA